MNTNLQNGDAVKFESGKTFKLKLPVPLSTGELITLKTFAESVKGDWELIPDEFSELTKKLESIRVNLLTLDYKNLTDNLKTSGATIPAAVEEAVRIIQSEIEAIRSYGLRNGLRVYGKYNAERKVRNRKAKERHRISNGVFIDEGESNAIPGEYENKIVCGDSLQVLMELPGNCIDLVFTSPPYNFGLDYEHTEDANVWDAYFDQLFAILEQVKRVLKHGGRLVINIQPLFSDYIPTHHIISNRLMEMGLLWKGEILWEKNNYNCKYTAWGSWKSPSSPYMKYTWEFLEVFCKGSRKHEGRAENADITAEEFKEWVVAKWSVAPERHMKSYGHPAMFPESLANRVLKLFSFKDDIVLDPFNGVGTTTAVAQKTGRRFLGIVISDEYCRTAVQRLSTPVLQGLL